MGVQVLVYSILHHFACLKYYLIISKESVKVVEIARYATVSVLTFFLSGLEDPNLHKVLLENVHAQLETTLVRLLCKDTWSYD